MLLIYYAEAQENILLSFTLTDQDSAEHVDFVLTTLEQYDANATFFFSGNYALKHQELVRLLAEKYEVSCTSMTEPRLPEVDQIQLREELTGCKATVENITGVPVRGFRAPSNLIDERTYELLPELGYEYDASAFENLGWFYPKPSIERIPINTFILVPMSDKSLAKTFHFGDFAYFIMPRDRDRILSIALHPHISYEHKGAFQYFMYTLSERDLSFVTHGSQV